MDFLKNAADSVSNAAAASYNAAKDGVTKVADVTTSGVSAGLNAAKDGVSKVGDVTAQGLNAAKEGVSKVGDVTASGLNSVKDGVSKVADVTTAGVTSGLNAAKDGVSKAGDLTGASALVPGQAKPTVVVFGSSGNIGAATIKSLAEKHNNIAVSAAARDPAKVKAQNGVTVIQGDMSNLASATAALAGADRAFIIPPGHESRTEVGITAVNACKQVGVKFVLLLSVSTVDQTDTVFGKQFIAIETALAESGLPHAIVRLPFFLENNFGSMDSIKSQGTIYGPANPDALQSGISVSDAGEASAVILANPEPHLGKKYNFVCKPFSNNELAAAFSSVLGKEVTYNQVPYDAAKSSFLGLGFPEWQVDGMIELFHLIDEGKYQYPEGDFAAVTGRAATTAQEWVAAVGPAFK